MSEMHVRAQVEPGFGAVQRLLLDLDRFGFALRRLHVTTAVESGSDLCFEAWVSGSGDQSTAALATRLERHFGVFAAVVCAD